MILGNSFSGAENVIVNELNMLIYYFDIHIIINKKFLSNFQSRLNNKVIIHPINYQSTFSSGLFNFKNNYLIYRIIKTNQPELVVTHNNVANVLIIFQKMIIKNLNIVNVEHNNLDIVKQYKVKLNSKLGSLFFQHYRRIFSKYIIKVICVSPSVKLYAKKYFHYSQEQLITLNNGVDLSQIKFNYIDRDVNINGSQQSYTVGSIGRLNEQKGYKYLISAARMLINEFPNIRFLIAGSGPFNEELEQMVEKQEMSKHQFEFLGQVDDIQHFLSGINIFVLPSLWEGLPLSLLEAMACGVPSIASDVDGNSVVIKSEYNGFLFPPKNSKAIYERLRYAMTHPSVMNQIGKIGQKTIKDKFNLNSRCIRLKGIIDSIVNKKENING